jgi:hypothetical protein
MGRLGQRMKMSWSGFQSGDWCHHELIQWNGLEIEKVSRGRRPSLAIIMDRDPVAVKDVVERPRCPKIPNVTSESPIK